MGLYALPQIVRDPREHGDEVRPLCSNASRWDCTLEPTGDDGRFAVRLGLRIAKELADAHGAGIVLVRQRPGSAKGVMFITLEDETGIANLVVWTKVFERHRRIVLSAGMIAVKGRVRREGEVVHLVAQRIAALSRELAGVGHHDGPFPLPHGRGDEFHHGSPAPDPRALPSRRPRPRDIFLPDRHVDAIRVKTRDFR